MAVSPVDDVKGGEIMAILSRDDFFNAIKTRIGDDTSDDAIKFIEDVTDTYNALDKDNSGEDWEKRYNENDKMWREKYRARFFDSEAKDDPTDVPEVEKKDPEQERAESISINDLFSDPTNNK